MAPHHHRPPGGSDHDPGADAHDEAGPRRHDAPARHHDPPGRDHDHPGPRTGHHRRPGPDPASPYKAYWVADLGRRA